MFSLLCYCQVVRLDVKERVAYLENGKSVTYDKCLIATGNVNNCNAILMMLIHCAQNTALSTRHGSFVISNQVSEFFHCIVKFSVKLV